MIVPCYRVAPYIERCARSLFSQMLDSIQFIFVDDCSDDDTIPRLESLIELFPCVRERTLIVRHEQNRGISAARETGMRYAEGEYIAYCDSDDWVDTGMYETLYNAALRQDADMVECGFWQDNGHFGADGMPGLPDSTGKTAKVRNSILFPDNWGKKCNFAT